MYVAEQSDERAANYNEKIDWSGIFAGALVAIIIGTLLSLLGVSIGAVSYTFNETTINEVSIKSGIWFVASALISMFFGGWSSTYYAQVTELSRGFMQGFLTYCLATLISFIALATTISFLMSGAFNLLQNSLIAANIAAENIAKIENEFSLNSIKKNSSGESFPLESSSHDLKEQAISQVRKTAENAIYTIGAFSLINFMILFLGAIAAGFGGVFGLKQQT